MRILLILAALACAVWMLHTGDPSGVLMAFPWAPLGPCGHVGCRNLKMRGKSRCEAHLGDLKVYDRARGNSTQRGFDYSWQQLRKQVIARDGGVCQFPMVDRVGICGQPGTEVDHVVARHLGGPTTLENTRLLCSFHHRQKTGREAARVRNSAR